MSSKSSDLLAHAQSNVDYYALLSLDPSTTSESDVRRAYRKTALKYHPDKLGADFDPEKFHLLQVANDVLSDPAAKAAYDAARGARVQKEKQERLFEGRRKAMKEELEAKERAGHASGPATGSKRQWPGQEAEDGMDSEIRKLAEEGKRRRMEKLKEQKVAERMASPSLSTAPVGRTPTSPVQEPAKAVDPASRTRDVSDRTQTAAEEAEEEDEVTRLERRIKELAEVKARRKAEKKARKSGLFTPSKFETPAGSTTASPKFSFSPRPKADNGITPQEDAFAKTMERLREAERRRLGEEIRKREATEG
jgi:DnaJ family protein C protein 17